MATNKRNLNSKKYNKALTLEDRITITNLISSNRDNSGNLTISLNEMAAILEKDPTTISKEVKNRHSKFKQLSFNFVYAGSYCKHCAKQSKCEIKQMVKDANDTCEEFEEYICPHLKKFPWVCNGCSKRSFCGCSKTYYSPSEAHSSYCDTLVDSRSGVMMRTETFLKIDAVVSLGIRMGQSVEHIIHSNDLPISTSTIYNYLNRGYLSANKAQTHRMMRLHIKHHKIAYNSIMLKKLKA